MSGEFGGFWGGHFSFHQNNVPVEAESAHFKGYLHEEISIPDK
jgi:hypothetical protein